MGDEDQEIKRILRTKNLYEILGVPKNVDDDELRRRYKRLALTCHPDKCKHPQAEEAFKAVGKAFSTLSDAQKRSQYDRYGEEGMQNVRTRQGEMQPEDIYDVFAQMFGADPNHMHGQRFAYRARRPQTQEPHPLQNTMQLFQVLPLIIFFLVYFLFSLGNDQSSPYSLHIDQDHGYSIRRKTKDHRIPYFVQPSFAQEYGRSPVSLQHIEEHVFEAYKQHLGRRCRYEQREKTAMQERAMKFYKGNEQRNMLDKAQKLQMPACDELNRLLSNYGY